MLRASRPQTTLTLPTQIPKKKKKAGGAGAKRGKAARSATIDEAAPDASVSASAEGGMRGSWESGIGELDVTTCVSPFLLSLLSLFSLSFSLSLFLFLSLGLSPLVHALTPPCPILSLTPAARAT